MPSYLDLGLTVVVLISALLSMLRGFTREVLAIASWAAAAAAAYYFHPLLVPTLKPYIDKDQWAMAAAAAAIFFATLIVISIITVRISDAILDSRIGALDRSLGFVFGAARGLLLCVVAYLFYSWLVPMKNQPNWVRDARTAPILQATGDQLMSMLPDDPDNTFLNRLRKPKGDEPMPEPPASPPPAPQPGRRT
jgi:membrane protein required for colicin V production